MLNEEIIQEELENLGFKLTETNHTLFTFMDNTRRIGVETRVYYDDKIYFHVFLRGYGYLKTIFQTAIIPFDSRKSELSKVENILNKNSQLVKKYEQYQKSLSFNFINEKKDLGIINNTKDKIMVWGLSSSEISFHISISVTSENRYKCYGTIYTGCDYETDLVNISKTLNNDEEVINLIEDMIKTSTDILKFIKSKRNYFN